MAKSDYFPDNDSELKIWLENFNLKIPGYAATFGFSAAQVSAVNADTLNFIYWLTQTSLFITEKEERVSYKNSLRDGPVGTPAGIAPTVPAIAAPPAAVLPGIVPRMRQLVQLIKNHASYTNSIGQDLNIIGAEQTTERSTLKPIIRLVLSGSGVNVKWTKGTAQALRIEKQIGGGVSPIPSPVGGSWTLLAIDTAPDYLDTTPITTPAVWKYRAIYIIDDAPFGLWSDEAQIAVG